MLTVPSTGLTMSQGEAGMERASGARARVKNALKCSKASGRLSRASVMSTRNPRINARIKASLNQRTRIRVARWTILESVCWGNRY